LHQEAVTASDQLQADSQPTLSPQDLLVTQELEVRPPRFINWAAESDALHHLARVMAQHPKALLDECAALALELCNAGSVGISLLHTTPAGEKVFVWAALAGAFARQAWGAVPRDFSPSGMCLDQGAPILLRQPARVFTYLEHLGADIVEAMILPIYGADRQALGTIWVMAHDAGRTFCRQDLQVMERFCDFTELALHMIDEAKAREALLGQINHRTKNLIASIQSFVLATRASADNVDSYADKLLGRLRAMSQAHDLLSTQNWEGASLRELVEAILHPRSESVPRYEIFGEDVRLNEQSTQALAMTLDELATNAAKYGALSVLGGKIRLQWVRTDKSLMFTWEEIGGPYVSPPTRKGFGTKLIEICIEKTLGGRVNCGFHAAGLRCEWQIPLESTIARV
jgi:two-component sensor histidine kinase